MSHVLFQLFQLICARLALFSTTCGGAFDRNASSLSLPSDERLRSASVRFLSGCASSPPLYHHALHGNNHFHALSTVTSEFSGGAPSLFAESSEQLWPVCMASCSGYLFFYLSSVNYRLDLPDCSTLYSALVLDERMISTTKPSLPRRQHP